MAAAFLAGVTALTVLESSEMPLTSLTITGCVPTCAIFPSLQACHRGRWYSGREGLQLGNRWHPPGSSLENTAGSRDKQQHRIKHYRQAKSVRVRVHELGTPVQDDDLGDHDPGSLPPGNLSKACSSPLM